MTHCGCQHLPDCCFRITRVQEVHLVIGHIIVELVDQVLFQGLGSSEIANRITND